MNFVYCICYIDRKHYKNINADLKKRGFKHIRAIIPEIKILKKSIKNKTFYEEVPVLFNYGFIKMPAYMAYSRPILNKIKKAIPGIHNWLKSSESMFPKKKKKRIDNAEDFDDFSIVATCSREDVKRFKKIAKQNQRFSLEDVLNIQEGQYVQLKIYPYEGTEAQIISIDQEKQMVTLKLFPMMGKFEVTIPIDHVVYSVYKDYDPDTFINPLILDNNRVTNELVEESFKNKQI